VIILVDASRLKVTLALLRLGWRTNASCNAGLKQPRLEIIDDSIFGSSLQAVPGEEGVDIDEEMG
jgi:hypothetical protein